MKIKKTIIISFNFCILILFTFTYSCKKESSFSEHPQTFLQHKLDSIKLLIPKSISIDIKNNSVTLTKKNGTILIKKLSNNNFANKLQLKPNGGGGGDDCGSCLSFSQGTGAEIMSAPTIELICIAQYSANEFLVFNFIH